MIKKILTACMSISLLFPIGVQASDVQPDDLPTPESNSDRLEKNKEGLSSQFDFQVDSNEVLSTFSDMKDSFVSRKSSIGEITYPDNSTIYQKFQKDLQASEQANNLSKKMEAYQNYLFNDQGTIKEYDSYLSYVGEGNTDTDYAAYLEKIRKENQKSEQTTTGYVSQYQIDLKNYMNGLIQDEPVSGEATTLTFDPSSQTIQALQNSQKELQVDIQKITPLGGFDEKA